MLAVVFSLGKVHQFTYDRHTTADSDYKSLSGKFLKDWRKRQSSYRKWTLKSAVGQYNIAQVRYIAEMLSIAYPPNSGIAQTKSEQINMDDLLLIRDERLKQSNVKRHRMISHDNDITKLAGDKKYDLPSQLVSYFHIRDACP